MEPLIPVDPEVTGLAFLKGVRLAADLKACVHCGLVLVPHVIVPTKSRTGTMSPVVS